MDAASETAKQVLGQMVEAGIAEVDSIHPHLVKVLKSF